MGLGRNVSGIVVVLSLAAAAGCGEVLGLGDIVLYEGGEGGSPSTGSESTTGTQQGSGSTSATTGTDVIIPDSPRRSTVGVVSAAGVAESASHRMVFAIGQSTPLQGDFTSAGHRMRGGVVGATGSEK